MNPEPAAGETRVTPDRLTHLLDESFSGEVRMPSETEARPQETATEIGTLRKQLDELVQKAGELARRQHELEQKLDALPEQLTDRIVASMLADREETIGWVTAESHRLHDQLTALIRGEVANRASGQQELEERLVARQGESMAQVEASSQSQYEALTAHFRDETQALLDELGGAIREAVATLGNQQEAGERRLAERQRDASNQLVEKLSLGLLTPLSEVRDETRRINEQLEASLLERIEIIAEEYRQFRARLAAAARLVEGRFEEVTKHVDDSLGAIQNQLKRLAPPTRKSAAPAPKKAPKPRAAKKATQPVAKKRTSGPTRPKRTPR